MITLSGVTKEFPGRTILHEVNLSIYRNEKIGLTGPNGAGKSTLFSIILGEMQINAGQVQIQKNINIGYLPQESQFSSERTVLEELTAGDTRIAKLLTERHKLEDANKADSHRYGDIMYELEQLGIYELEHRAEKVLSGLGFKEYEFHKPVAELSGGWQMRTLLAKMLTYDYDLILLDEPTNYLDMSATLWLKDYLANYKGSFVLISHDKVFLNEVTNYTIVLEDTIMTKIKGNYEYYEKNKQVRRRTLEKKQKVVDKKRQQLERFTQRFHAQPNRASAVRNKRKQIERLEKIDIATEKKSIKDFEFPETKRSGHSIISLNNISKSYGNKEVYKGLDFEVTRGQKICLVGENGAGKSTLLKMVAGVVKSDSGARKLGTNVELGYFSQSRLDVLNPNKNVFEEVLSAVPGSIPAVQVRTLLGLFNFHGDDVFKLVKVLSGGEKSRLILAKLLIRPPNFILLDEPTTHLDIDGVEALTTAFRAFKGTLVFISHDLFFVKEIANEIIEVENGKLITFPGGFDYYLDKKAGREMKEPEPMAQKKRTKGVPVLKGKRKNETPEETRLHDLHKKAVKRLKEIKEETKLLKKEDKELETESYIKSRILSQSFSSRSKEDLKNIGQRLKEIQKRHREIATTIKKLTEEKRKINK